MSSEQRLPRLHPPPGTGEGFSHVDVDPQKPCLWALDSLDGADWTAVRVALTSPN